MEECFEKLALVTTPTRAWLEANLGQCQSRFMVASPYIGSCLLDLSQSIPPGVHRSLLTSTDLRSFAMGASDIHALSKISKEGVNVLSLNRLHAKTYIIDETCALVTSANATHSGLTRNWECGVAIRSSEMVNSLAEQLLSGFGSPEPPLRVNENDLTAMRIAVEAIRPLLRPLQRIKDLIDQQVEELEGIEILNRAAVLSGFQGWTRLTFEGVLMQPEDAFSLDDLLLVCEANAKSMYPTNKNVRAKLRQQLQRLRDFGLVSFLGKGRYRKRFVVSGEDIQ
jgi:hypothetical protein